ncbi:MAG: ABC transporter ATP-binding protein [Ilumatobacteraceae bacterium]
MSDRPVIEVTGLVVEYPTSPRSGTTPVRAVDGLDLEVRIGEVYALLGENGAGKTSTIEVLEGHRRRTSGTVRVLGHDPARRGRPGREWRDRIGVVLQSSGIEPELTVREAVALFAGVYSRPRPAGEVLAVVGLDDRADVPIGALSGGQRRRLDLATAIVGRPEVLFLDEPTTGFDPSARRRAWEVISGLCSEGTTVVLTTHYLDEAEHLADRVGIMSAGRLVVEGTPDELQRRSGTSRVDVALSSTVTVEAVSVVLDGLVTSVSVDGNRLGVVTAEVTEVLARLTTWAGANGIVLDDWSVERPSLEQVFIDLTEGRS